MLKRGAVVLALAGILIVWLEGGDIESSIETGVQEAMSVPGMERIGVQVSGRHVVLDGEVSTREEIFRALDLASHAPGVRTVEQRMEVRPVRLAYLRIAVERKDHLSIEGELPSKGQARQLVELVVSTIDHRRLLNRLQVNPEVTAPEWFDLLPVIIGELRWIEGVELEIGAGRVAIGGLTREWSQYSVLMRRIREFLARYDMQFVNRIGIYSPDDT